MMIISGLVKTFSNKLKLEDDHPCSKIYSI